MNFEHYGGRRFLLIVFTQISITALLWFDKLSEDLFSMLTASGTITYAISNVTQKIKELSSGHTLDK